MTREQLLATLAILGVLLGAVKQFYDLKTEVAVQNEQIQTLRERFEYVNGSGWQMPAGAK